MRYAVILAGGKGERFWPLSRSSRPKQLLKILGDKSMLRMTAERLEGFIPAERRIVILTGGIAPAVKLEIADERMLIEPCGRNTALAVGFAAVEIMKESSDAVMAVLPADHYIGEKELFLRALEVGFEYAEKGSLVTFGVVPSRPETGYGYIELGKEIDRGVFSVERFREKPNTKEAMEYLRSGRFLWNSGMFVWKASVILEEIKRYLPEMGEYLQAYMDGKMTVEELYDRSISISIDYGVMERSKRVVVVKANFSWDDVGSWLSLERIHPRDKDKNVVLGDSALLDTSECVVFSDEGKLVATLGINGLIVVNTGDVVLVADKSRAQDVRALVEFLADRGKKKYL